MLPKCYGFSSSSEGCRSIEEVEGVLSCSSELLFAGLLYPTACCQKKPNHHGSDIAGDTAVTAVKPHQAARTIHTPLLNGFCMWYCLDLTCFNFMLKTTAPLGTKHTP